MDLFVLGLFWLLALAALVSGVVVVAHKSPIGSVFALIVNSASLAGMYLILGDAFLAAIQVIVYSGAILVLFLFVVMLLDLRRDELAVPDGRVRRAAVLLLATGFAFLLGLGLFYGLRSAAPASGAVGWGSLPELADHLFSKYILVFEAVSVLLLAAMVGVVVLTKKGFGPSAGGQGEGEERQ